MDPALMFGMVSEHDEDDDETFDLSGWMSRSPPSDGLGDAPMIEDTPSFTSRPRGGVTSNVAAAAMASGPEPSFTARPRANPRNMGYVAFAESAGPFKLANPLYAHDDSKIFGFTGANNPKVVVAIKSAGLATMAGTVLWGRFRPNTRLFTLGALAYAHPVLGWNHGVFRDYGSWFKNGLKGVAHSAILGIVTYKILLKK